LKLCSADEGTEAAIDANAPLEDEEEANGPFDSDEELQGVMTGLTNWNPQPLVQPEPQIPIQRKYQKEALYEQLRQATNGFTVNIFAVKGYGVQKLQPGHPGLLNHLNADGDADADGEVDGAYGLSSGMQGAASRRASGFNIQMPPSRRLSMASQASQR
jgi:SAGA-associated factor 73